jgi:hypothetical protein
MQEEDDQIYIYKLYGISIPRRFRAQNNIRMRIGYSVKITEEQIQDAQDHIEQQAANYDYQPYVTGYLNEIRLAIQAIRDTDHSDDNFYNQIVLALVQIKGQAAMFGNPIASQLSHLTIRFIEHYRRYDEDILKIIEVCCAAIEHSYNKNILSNKSIKGKLLIDELKKTMERYNEKFKRLTGR